MFLYFPNGKVRRYYAGTIRRFLLHVRGCSSARIDVLVSYGKKYDYKGRLVEFTNRYIGTNKQEAIHAIKAFFEN